MLRHAHIFSLRLTVQHQAFMVTITMDTNEAPPSKVKRMSDSKAGNCTAGSSISGGPNRLSNFKWLRKYANKTASRQTGTDKTSTRNTSLNQTDAKSKLKPSASSETFGQVTAVQAPAVAAPSLVQPLSLVNVVKNGLSMLVPQFQSAGFFSSLVPVHMASPSTLLQANYHMTYPEPGSLLQANNNMTTPGPVAELQANYDMTNAGSGTKLQELQANWHIAHPEHITMLQASNNMTTPGPVAKLHANYDMTNAGSGTKLQELQANWHIAHPEHITMLQASCHTTTSSLSSMLPSKTAAQPHSQLVRASNLQPAMSYLSNPQVWSTFSTKKTLCQARPSLDSCGSQISRECTSQSSSVDIHLSAGGQTCPELTRTPRRWHTIRQSDAEVGSLEFTIMSYNILSQELLYRHMYLYSRCSESDLEWATRGPALLTQIVAHNADIVCLQEVQEDHWSEDIRDMLAKQGYRGVYKKHAGDSDKPDGCAILFKVSKFKQLKFVPVEFMKGGILDRSNVGIILLLQPRQEVYGGSVKKMCVATTHLLFNPRRGDVKLAQLVLFLAEIDKHAYEQDELSRKNLSTSASDCTLPASSSNLKKGSQDSDGEDIPEAVMRQDESHSRHSYCPIILCGDFNTEPFSDLYRFVTTGHLRYDRLVSRLVCGQKEGQEGGTNRKVDKILLPKELSISETCQYIKVLNKRQSTSDGANQHPKVNSGQVFHGMNFQSVYSHYVGHRQEISSCHNNCSCTVDYIFYSTSKARQQQKGPAMDTQGSKTSQCHDGSLSDIQQCHDGSLSDIQQCRDGSLSDSQQCHDGSLSDSQQCRDGSLSDSQQRTSSTADGPIEADTFREPLELLARYSLLTTKQVAKFGSMPNSTLPSDHLCLIARFLLR